METWLALITAVAALLGTFTGYFKLQHDSRARIRELRTQLQAGFLESIVEERTRLYPPVFELLSSVRDRDPSREHHVDLKQNPSQLIRVADDLLGHLYGNAGLVMSMPTRNVLLDVCEDCYWFHENATSIDTTSIDESIRRIIYGFFLARRVLRADLQLEDMERIKTESKRLSEEFGKTA